MLRYSKLTTNDNTLSVDQHIGSDISKSTLKKSDVLFARIKGLSNSSDKLVVSSAKYGTELLVIEKNDLGRPIVSGSSINGFTDIDNCFTILKNWKTEII